MEAAFTETDGGVERGEAAKPDVESGNGGAGAEFTVLVLEDRDQGGGGGDLFGVSLFGSGGLERCCGDLLEQGGGSCRNWRRAEGPGCFGVVRVLSLLWSGSAAYRWIL